MQEAAQSNSEALQEMAAAMGIPEFWMAVIVKVVLSIVVLIIGYILYRLIMLPVRKLLVENDNSRRGGLLFKNIVRVGVAAWVVCCLIDIIFDIDMVGIIGALGVVGVAVSLGAQQTIANLIGGIIISLSKELATGDWVVIGGIKEAQIKEMGWRLTKLVDEDGVEYQVPNSKMVSEIVALKLPFYTIVVPFTIKTTVPDVEGLLADCEQALLERQVERGIDFEAMRPKAHVSGASLGTIQAEVKLYVNRAIDTRSAERAILPVLVGLLQERDAFAEFEAPQIER